MDSSIVPDTSQLSEVLQLMGYLQGNLPWILVLVASAAVMQLITMVVLLTGRKGGRGHHHGQDRRPGTQFGERGKPDKGQGGAPHRTDGGGQRKSGDGSRGGGQRQGGQQQGGRQQPERGGRPNQPSIDPMEMSLRDINQRLKNAEREQDSARKNMRDGDGASGEGRGGGGGRQQQRGGRDGRGGGGNRDDKGGHRRDSGRDNRGGGRPERQERPPQEHDRFRHNEYGTDAPERPPAPEIIPNDMGVTEDQLQHGRRFTAKRRMLPDEAGAPEEQRQPAPENASAPTGNSHSFAGQEQDNTENIQFGR
ncbi:MAG: hypothetical protein LBB74_08675 [Chitinispirillales bacterium]|jgi:hypothetical protein|nr:hypothetical protein [Chitinispirillales bacterium]